MGKSGANYLRRFGKRVARVLLEHRWLLIILLSASAIIFEIIEHQNVENPVDIHFVREVVFFGIFYPLGVGLLLNALLKVQGQRNYILRQKEIEQKLSQKLMLASTWESLCNQIVLFPQMLTAAVGVRLFTVSEDNHTLNLEAEWWLAGTARKPRLQPPIPLDYCGIAGHKTGQHLHLCASSGSEDFRPSLKVYCLPLYTDHRWLGSLDLYMPLSEQLSSDQISILNDLAPTIAQAMEAARHTDRLDSHNLVIQNERERIARQLHDTLGQNLAYLRLKLDQMSAENALQEIDVVQQDLERMRDIAYQAHEQIRQALVSLKPDGAAGLNDLLLAQAQAVAEQAAFTLYPHISGVCVPLPSTIQRKIHAIFREALFNVEKHARANNVHHSILWENSTASLTVKLEDDGIGFDPQQTPAEGQFCLLIMRQRAEEINARLTITTAPSQGTLVALHYPLPQPALAAED
jgi:signal transduction histidine kinase